MFDTHKTRIIRLLSSEEIMTIEYQNATDRQTDRWTDGRVQFFAPQCISFAGCKPAVELKCWKVKLSLHYLRRHIKQVYGSSSSSGFAAARKRRRRTSLFASAQWRQLDQWMGRHNSTAQQTAERLMWWRGSFSSCGSHRSLFLIHTHNTHSTLCIVGYGVK